MRVAVIGNGRQGKRRAKHLAKLCEVAVYDTDPGRSQFKSLRDALAWADAVAICTPTDAHAEVAAECAGMRTLVEKPMAHTLEAARAMATMDMYVSLPYTRRIPLPRLRPTVVRAYAGHGRRMGCGRPLLDLGTHALSVAMEIMGWPRLTVFDRHDGTLHGSVDCCGEGLSVHVEASFTSPWPDTGVIVVADDDVVCMGAALIEPRDFTVVGGALAVHEFSDECWDSDCAAFLRGEDNVNKGLALMEVLCSG
jgi:predicted dehydrogenase